VKAVFLAKQFKNSVQAKKVAGKVVKEAVFDPSITIFIDVPECCSVRELELDSEVNEMAFHLGLNVDGNYEGEKVDDIKGLVLDAMDLVHLMRNDNALVSSFPEGVIFSENKGEIEIIIPNYIDYSRSEIAPRAYYVFLDDKNSAKFSDKRPQNIVLSLNNLFAAVDITKVKEWCEVRELLPSLFELPNEIQEQLKKMPDDFKGMSKRLRYMKDAYQQHWEGKYSELMSSSNNEIESINDKVINFLLGRFESEVRETGRPFGKETAESAAEIIEPDYLDNDHKNFPNTVSQGVSTKFWILHSILPIISEYKGYGVEFDVDAVTKILYAVNRPEEKAFLRTEEREVLDDLYLSHPEIHYFRESKFSKKHAGVAATLFL